MRLGAPNVMKKRHFFALHPGFFLKINRLIVKHCVLLEDFLQNCENKVFFRPPCGPAAARNRCGPVRLGVFFSTAVKQQKQQLIAA